MALCSSALAGAPHDPLFLATQGDTLFRFGLSGTVQSFTLPDTVIAMARNPQTGTIYAMSEHPTAGPFGGELYRLDDPFGAAPTLTLLDDTLTRLYPSITFINGEMYGFENVDDTLRTIDLGTFDETVVGATGFTGITAVGASGFDADNGVLYAMGGLSSPEELYTIDWTLSNGTDPSATLVGAYTPETLSHGGEFYNGELWMMTNNADTGFFEIGRFDTGAGSWSSDRAIAPAIQANTALVIVPAPGGALAMALAGVFAARRRR